MFSTDSMPTERHVNVILSESPFITAISITGNTAPGSSRGLGSISKNRGPYFQ